MRSTNHFSKTIPKAFSITAAEDVRWTIAGENTSTGKQAVRDFMASCGEGREPPKFDVKQTIAEGDSVVCYGDMTMTGPDGQPGAYAYCDIYRFDGEKVAELISYVVQTNKADKNLEASA